VLELAGQPRLIRAVEVAEAIVDMCADDTGEWNGEILALDGVGTP